MQDMLKSFKDMWKEDKKHFISCVLILVFLMAILYFGLWFIAITEGKV